MLAGLRHGTVVRRHHEEHEVDAGGACEHVVNQPLVARDVDEAENGPVGQGHVGIAEVEGDAAGLLFGQAVGVDSREGPDQGRLAVVDVSGGADQHGALTPRGPGPTARAVR